MISEHLNSWCGVIGFLILTKIVNAWVGRMLRSRGADGWRNFSGHCSTNGHRVSKFCNKVYGVTACLRARWLCCGASTRHVHLQRRCACYQTAVFVSAWLSWCN
ncbi:hypothetical protein KC19_VG142300 [Ceratodon purpureus]|uniref:Uncharacterized protein n=1 Tax=Ceratodon purpureus TaxID=3225 RepID=A0A8T0HQF9_CERPU|nr:hypothetical protein KC19_VG142300 [Ceratodon purpureus]